MRKKLLSLILCCVLSVGLCNANYFTATATIAKEIENTESEFISQTESSLIVPDYEYYDQQEAEKQTGAGERSGKSIEVINPDTLSEEVSYVKTYYLGTNSSLTDSLWEQCSSAYQYENYAVSDVKKNLYNDILQILKNTYDGNGNFETILSDEENYICYGKINCSEYDISDDEKTDILAAVLFDHPLVFFNSSTVVFFENTMYLLTDETCDTNSEINEKREEIENAIKDIADSAKNEDTNADKAMVIHDFIIDNVDYAYKEDGVSPREDIAAHNISGYISDEKIVVCEGYAKIYMAAMLYSGIDTTISTGWGIEDGASTAGAENHAWNICCLDGSYYAVDLTWDDNLGHNNVNDRYTYFAVGQSIYQSHSVTKKNDSSYTFVSYVPELNKDDYEIKTYDYSIDSISYSIYGKIATVVKYSGTDAVVNIPDYVDGARVVAVSGKAFSGCKTLTSVTFPSTLIKIKDGGYDAETWQTMGAFNECVNLNTVIIPSDSELSYIGEWAFYGCSALENITLPNSIRTLGLSCFQSCSSLEELNLPEGIKVIEQNALTGTGLKYLYIPKSVESFHFANNLPELEEIEVSPENSTLLSHEGVLYYYGDWVSCSVSLDGSTFVDNTGTGWGLVIYPKQKKDMEYTVYPECEVIFTNDGIRENSYLQILNLLNVVEVSGQELMCDFTVSETNEKYKAEEGMLYSKDGTVLYRISARIDGEVKVPDGTKIIDNSAGRGGKYQSVVIPDGVERIGEGAFIYCDALESVTMTDSVKYIGNNCFYDCHSLKDISLSNGITTIAWNTFAGCESLEQIEIPESVTEIEMQAFSDCFKLKSIKLPDNLSAIGVHMFMNCWSLSSIKIPNTVTSIGFQAFYGCSSLTSIEIPNSVTYIPDGAFESCENLTIYGEKASYAEQYASEYNIPFVAIKILLDDITNIYVKFNEDNMCEDISLKTKKMSESDKEYTNINFKGKITDSIVKPEDVKFSAYDISLVDENNSLVQPTGTVTVKIPCPADYNGENCKVYRVGGTGEFTDMNAKYQNGYMVFETDHFSTYIITETELITGVQVIEGDANSDGNMDIKDSAIIKRYLAGWDVEIDMTAADMDGDGKVTIKDSAFIKRQLSGWE